MFQMAKDPRLSTEEEAGGSPGSTQELRAVGKIDFI